MLVQRSGNLSVFESFIRILTLPECPGVLVPSITWFINHGQERHLSRCQEEKAAVANIYKRPHSSKVFPPSQVLSRLINYHLTCTIFPPLSFFFLPRTDLCVLQSQAGPLNYYFTNFTNSTRGMVFKFVVQYHAHH